MPYENIKDLPDNVQDNIPVHAQEIYRAAYNQAYEEYNHDESRAHRVAWAAVEKKYKKDEKTGHWIAIKEGSKQQS